MRTRANCASRSTKAKHGIFDSLAVFFFSSRRRHTRFDCDWSSDVCSSDLGGGINAVAGGGSFVAFPALLFTGVPAIPAKATNTLALWVGTTASGNAYPQKLDRKSTRLNSSHSQISYAVFCLKKKKKTITTFCLCINYQRRIGCPMTISSHTEFLLFTCSVCFSY